MSTDPQHIHSESHSEIGLIIQRDATILLERWTRRAVDEQPNAERVHHRALLDHLHDLLGALGRSLIETDLPTTNGHCLTATAHGEQRWEAGWSLPEVVRDYQILRLVILDYLEESLDRPLGYREVMAIGLVLDEAIAASVSMYALSREQHLREMEEKRAQLSQQIQDQLRQQADALRVSDRRKNEFLATLGHELRNPLAPLRNAVSVLYLQPPADPDVVQVRDIFDRQVRQMTRLVDDLLDAARIAQGKVVLQKERVNLSTALTQAVQVSEPLLKARQLHFAISLPTEQVWLDADPTRLVQIVVNLLNNAAKYTDRGGRVWLSAEREGEKVVTRVRDTGIGIAPELLPHIFDLFTQAEWPADRSQGGLGIGLTLVRRLVELHGGAIAASSSGPGQGSEFVVRLPALPATSAPGESRQPSDDVGDTPPPHRRRILVVDDHVDAAESLALLLRLQGHELHIAYDGAAALATAEKTELDVVILDIGLPRMDGYQVAKRLRQQKGADRMLLIALTGYGREEDRRSAAEAGFNAHLVKPVDVDMLRHLLIHGKPSVLRWQ